MPLATSLNKTTRIVLTDDVGTEPEPAFFYRFLSYSEWSEVQEYYTKIEAAEGEQLDALIGDKYQKLFDKLRYKLVGWENMGVDYDPAQLEHLLTLSEAFQLLGLKTRQAPTTEDKKKYESQLPSSSVNSAKDVKAKPSAKKSSA